MLLGVKSYIRILRLRPESQTLFFDSSICFSDSYISKTLGRTTGSFRKAHKKAWFFGDFSPKNHALEIIGKSELRELLYEVYELVGITPFVVVPGYHFCEVIVEGNAGFCIENTGAWVAQEVL